MAAGYKALMLCGAIANAERIGRERHADHVAQWELVGIQAPLDSIVRDLPFSITTNANGVIDCVAVEWAEDGPARFAQYRGQHGCALNRTDPLYFGGTTIAQSAGHWPLLHRPGTVFRYANNDTLMAIAAIHKSFERMPVVEQLGRLDMTNTTAEADWAG